MILPFLRSATAWLLGALLLAVALPRLHAQHRFTRLHSFGATNLPMFAPSRFIEGRDGAFYGTDLPSSLAGVVKFSKSGSDFTLLNLVPASNGVPVVVLQGADGTLYGTTSGGWVKEAVFKLNHGGTDFTVLHTFQHAATVAGVYPGALIEGSDNVLYGTTSSGGTSNQGSVFKLNQDGSGYAVLHSFLDSEGDGNSPRTLLEGSDGALYGETPDWGGADNAGTVFRLNKDGTGFTILHRFSLGAAGGTRLAPVIEGSDGALYGMTMENNPTVFRLNKNGTEFTILKQLEEYPSWDEWSSLVEGADGALYGSQEKGGASGKGWLFKLNKDGTGFAPLHEFTGTDGDGASPYSGLVKAMNGEIYGTTDRGGLYNHGTLFKVNPDGSGYQVLTSFQGNVPLTDGTNPRGIVEGNDGRLYGVTRTGGSDGQGTVFHIDPDGTRYGIEHEFEGNADEDGSAPTRLLKCADGALFGITSSGGGYNAGTVFRLPDDGMVLIYEFQDGTNDGRQPANLIEGSDGALYGTTRYGGLANGGTIFKLNKDGTGFESLHHFESGLGSHATLVQGSDGALYGTTSIGGISNAGIVFTLSTNGTGFAVLHDFLGESGEGGGPTGLLEGSDRLLYGVNYNWEAVFRLNRDGSGYTQLHTFDYRLHGAPNGPLIEGYDGVLYGTTEEGGGGDDNYGTLFSVGKDGSGFAILRIFRREDGAYIEDIMAGSDGAIYGVTWDGGAYGFGTLFRLEVAPVLFKPFWTGNVFSFQFNARSNAVYQPQFKTSLADSNWTALPNLSGQRGVVTVTDTNLPAAPRFYRVVIP